MHEVRRGNKTVRSVKTNSALKNIQKASGMGSAASDTGIRSETLGREGLILPQPSVEAVIKGRNRGNKEWGVQRRPEMGNELL